VGAGLRYCDLVLDELRFNLTVIVCQAVPAGAVRDRRLAFLDATIESMRRREMIDPRKVVREAN
jgi:hypothetical protein